MPSVKQVASPLKKLMEEMLSSSTAPMSRGVVEPFAPPPIVPRLELGISPESMRDLYLSGQQKFADGGAVEAPGFMGGGVMSEIARMLQRRVTNTRGGALPNLSMRLQGLSDPLVASDAPLKAYLKQVFSQSPEWHQSFDDIRPIGRGVGRAVFELKSPGAKERDTVLKIGKQPVGVRENGIESDYLLHDQGLIPGLHPRAPIDVLDEFVFANKMPSDKLHAGMTRHGDGEDFEMQHFMRPLIKAWNQSLVYGRQPRNISLNARFRDLMEERGQKGWLDYDFDNSLYGDYLYAPLNAKDKVQGVFKNPFADTLEGKGFTQLDPGFILNRHDAYGTPWSKMKEEWSPIHERRMELMRKPETEDIAMDILRKSDEIDPIAEGRAVSGLDSAGYPQKTFGFALGGLARAKIALAKGGYVDPNIDRYLDEAEEKYQLPKGLLHSVAEKESRKNPMAVGKAGEIGMMQFMPGTAARYKIDPRDPKQAAFGAGAHLRDLLDEFGTLEKALAGWNWGPGHVAKGKAIPKQVQDYTHDVLAKMTKRNPDSAVQKQQVASVAPGVMDMPQLVEDNPQDDDWELQLMASLLKNNAEESIA